MAQTENNFNNNAIHKRRGQKKSLYNFSAKNNLITFAL